MKKQFKMLPIAFLTLIGLGLSLVLLENKAKAFTKLALEVIYYDENGNYKYTDCQLCNPYGSCLVIDCIPDQD